MHWNVPNTLTLLRILAIPLIVILFYSGWEHAGPYSAIAFAIAGITDWLDGYLARKLNQISRFGKFLDPVADKLIVAVTLIILVEYYNSLVLTLAAIVIISREIGISALREWMAEVGQQGKVSVSYIGKIKTTIQMVAIFMLLYYESLLGIDMQKTGLVLLILAAILTLYSMFNYLKAAFADKQA